MEARTTSVLFDKRVLVRSIDVKTMLEVRTSELERQKFRRGSIACFPIRSEWLARYDTKQEVARAETEETNADR